MPQLEMTPFFDIYFDFRFFDQGFDAKRWEKQIEEMSYEGYPIDQPNLYFPVTKISSEDHYRCKDERRTIQCYLYGCQHRAFKALGMDYPTTYTALGGYVHAMIFFHATAARLLRLEPNRKKGDASYIQRTVPIQIFDLKDSQEIMHFRQSYSEPT